MVKNRDAAANPALRALTSGVESTGVALRPAGAGGIEGTLGRAEVDGLPAELLNGGLDEAYVDQGTMSDAEVAS
ncbi:hypothetical protein [Actinokineospora diospyrosa]|uniref:Uncharacterized protein n=1 Tax=Actinokineospora diospyrosa TaxID=103728 RepID=A0ABT1IMJ9_9PSEU|nr:hypothetical protein [Actinokineospora diospyrosa]MCP2273897.1 hypothetical protein [Actinokineospora diospyrosa]